MMAIQWRRKWNSKIPDTPGEIADLNADVNDAARTGARRQGLYTLLMRWQGRLMARTYHTWDQDERDEMRDRVANFRAMLRRLGYDI
jgi:hypothetical protein